MYVKTNFNDFKTKFWSTFQECHSLGFSTKEWDGTQGSGFGIGHRGCADVWPALAESPQTLQPLSGCWLHLCIYFHPMHWHGEVPFASLHPPSPCRHPQQQRKPGAVTLPEGSAGVARPTLKMDRRWKLPCLSFSFSLALTSPRFWAGCMGQRQKLSVPLWHFKFYLIYTWFLIKSLCCFVMEAITFSASIPAKSFSERSHSPSRDLTGLPVSTAISVAAVTFYYKFRKSPQCSTCCEIMQTTLSFFFFCKSSEFFSSAGHKYNLSLHSCPVYYTGSQQLGLCP